MITKLMLEDPERVTRFGRREKRGIMWARPGSRGFSRLPLLRAVTNTGNHY